MFNSVKKITCIISVLMTAAFALAEPLHITVYEQEGKFCGWPANEGIWSWGNEILVGFNIGDYLYNPNGHSIDPASTPPAMVQARSLDGGQNWILETPEAFDRSRDIQPAPGRINFTDPDFAMKCRNSKYWYSYDRGRNWRGPFLLPAMDQVALHSRTDYIVNSQCEALFFIPSAKPDGEADRCMAFITKNGGRTFNFLSYIGPCPPIDMGSSEYCTMPSTVKLYPGIYITALRQRRASENNRKWIDIYKSQDNGKSWTFLTKAVDQNWNPASMIKLNDGRICLTYGWRYPPQGIRAKTSEDDGENWSEEIILRDDGGTWDIGYPRTIQRPDGKVVTVYYYSTESTPQQHIAATIWQP